MLNTASELYNDLLGIYFDEYYELSDAKKIESKYDPDKLFLKAYNFDIWFENEETNDTIRKIKDLSDMSEIEAHEEVKEGKELKFLTPIGLLTRLSTSLAQIKARNNSNKLKKEIRQILYLLC